MAGADIPIVNLKHQYFVTDDLPELERSGPELPIIRDSRVGGYYRQEQKSILIGPWEFDNIDPAWGGGAPAWDSENELFTDDLERIEHYIIQAIDRMPFHANAGVKTVVNGAIPFTPDANPLLGPTFGLRNFWQCNGSNIGIAQGPGIGHYLAQLMVHGDAEIDMSSFDPRRFGDYSLGSYVDEKAVESYSYYARSAVGGEDRPAGRPQRVSPLYDTLKEKGAVYVEAHGWERPKWFSTDGRQEDYSFTRTNIHELIAAECETVRERVGVMDMTSFAMFEVAGKDATSFLNRICANKLPGKDGRIGLSQTLTENGRIFSEVTITRLSEDKYYLVSGASAEERDIDYLLNNQKKILKSTESDLKKI